MREKRLRERTQRKGVVSAQSTSTTDRVQTKNSHLRVHLPLDLAPLAGRAARVHDNLRVGSGEEDDTDDPGRVPDDTTSQKRRLEVDRVFLVGSAVGAGLDDGRVKPEHVDVGGFAVDLEPGGSARLGGSKVRELGNGMTRLEVRLSVQVLGLDVGDVLLLRGGANGNI